MSLSVTSCAATILQQLQARGGAESVEKYEFFQRNDNRIYTVYTEKLF